MPAPLKGRFCVLHFICVCCIIFYCIILELFLRLSIVPAVDQTTPNKGNIYATSLDASGFAIYGRNRLESDPTTENGR